MKKLESISATYLVSKGDRVVVNVGSVSEPKYAIGIVRSIRSDKASILLDSGDIVRVNAPKRVFYKVGIVGIGIDKKRTSFIPARMLSKWITVKEERVTKGLIPSYNGLVTMIKRVDSLGLEGRKRSEVLRDYLVAFVSSLASQVVPKGSSDEKPTIALSKSASILTAGVRLGKKKNYIFSIEASSPLTITVGDKDVRARYVVKNTAAKNKEIFSVTNAETQGSKSKVTKDTKLDDATILQLKPIQAAIKEIDKAFKYLYDSIDDSIKALTIQKPFRKMRDGEFEGSYLNEKSMWDSVRNQKAKKYTNIEPDVKLILSKGRESIIKSIVSAYKSKGNAGIDKVVSSRTRNIHKYADTLNEFFNTYVGIMSDTINARYNQLNGVLSLIDWNAATYTPIHLDRRGTYSARGVGGTTNAGKSKPIRPNRGDEYWLSNSRTGIGMIVKLKASSKGQPGGEYIVVDGNIVASGKYVGMPELTLVKFEGSKPAKKYEDLVIRKVRRNSMQDFIKDAVRMGSYPELTSYQQVFFSSKKTTQGPLASKSTVDSGSIGVEGSSLLRIGQEPSGSKSKIEQGDVIAYKQPKGNTVTKIVSSVNYRKGTLTFLDESIPLRLSTRYPIEGVVEILMKGNGFVDHMNKAYERFGYSSEQIGGMLEPFIR